MAPIGIHAGINHPISTDMQTIIVGVGTIITAAILIGIWRLVVRFFRKALKTLDDNTDAIRELRTEMASLQTSQSKWTELEMRVLGLEKWKIEVEVILHRAGGPL